MSEHFNRYAHIYMLLICNQIISLIFKYSCYCNLPTVKWIKINSKIYFFCLSTYIITKDMILDYHDPNNILIYLFLLPTCQNKSPAYIIIYLTSDIILIMYMWLYLNWLLCVSICVYVYMCVIILCTYLLFWI